MEHTDAVTCRQISDILMHSSRIFIAPNNTNIYYLCIKYNILPNERSEKKKRKRQKITAYTLADA